MSRNVKRRLNYDGDNNSEDNHEDNNSNNNSEDNNNVDILNVSYRINLTPNQIVRDCIFNSTTTENGRVRLSIKFPDYFKYFNNDTKNFIKNTVREAILSGEFNF